MLRPVVPLEVKLAGYVRLKTFGQMFKGYIKLVLPTRWENCNSVIG